MSITAYAYENIKSKLLTINKSKDNLSLYMAKFCYLMYSIIVFFFKYYLFFLISSLNVIYLI